MVSGPSAPSGQQGRPDLSQAALAASVFRAPLSTCAGCCSERGSAATRRGQAPWGCGGCGGLRLTQWTGRRARARPGVGASLHLPGASLPHARRPGPRRVRPCFVCGGRGGGRGRGVGSAVVGLGTRPSRVGGSGSTLLGAFPRAPAALPPSPRCHSARVLGPDFNRRPCRHWFLSPWKWRCPLTSTGTSSGRRAAGSAR